MGKVKNALLDMELTNDMLNWRRDELATFKSENAYTRGGTYPKEIASRKKDLAQSIVRLHLALINLGLTKVPAKNVWVSRRTVVRPQDFDMFDPSRKNSAEMFTLRRRNTHA